MRLAGSRSLNKLAAMYSPTFHLFLWPHRLLFLGPAFDAQPHRHHAAQLALGLHDRLRVRGGQDQPWQEAAAFYVPPDVPHEFDAGDTPCALLYLDPEGRPAHAPGSTGISRGGWEDLCDRRRERLG